MIKKTKGKSFKNTLKQSEVLELLKWYKKNKRNFPWRTEKPNPYHVWIAEIMSQQTRMAALVPYYFRFIDKFPNIESLAKASLEDVYKVWAGLGYYSRARMIHKASQILKNGIPKSYEEWLQIPGVGPYTAASITAQCFQGLEPVWDGNVIRVMSRVWMEKNPFDKVFRENATKELKKYLNKKNTSELNQAWMELGALVCTKDSPNCSVCVFSKSCMAYKNNKIKQFPHKKIKANKKNISANVWIFQNSKNDLLLVPRKSEKNSKVWFEGLWDFPSELGGVVEPVRKLNLPKFKSPDIEVKHTITNHKIILKAKMSSQKTVRVNGGKWISFESLILSLNQSSNQVIPLATTAKKILRQLLILQNQ